MYHLHYALPVETCLLDAQRIYIESGIMPLPFLQLQLHALAHVLVAFPVAFAAQLPLCLYKPPQCPT